MFRNIRLLMLLVSSFPVKHSIPTGEVRHKELNKNSLAKSSMKVHSSPRLFTILQNQHGSGVLIRKIRQVLPPPDIVPPRFITPPTHIIPPTTLAPLKPIIPSRSVTPPTHIVPPTTVAPLKPIIPSRSVTPPTHIPPTTVAPLKPIIPSRSVTPPTHTEPPTNTTPPTNVTAPMQKTSPKFIIPPDFVLPPIHITEPPFLLPPEHTKRTLVMAQTTTTAKPSTTKTNPPPKQLCETEPFDPSTLKCTNSSMSQAYSCESRCNDLVMVAGVDKGPYCSCHPLCMTSLDCCHDFHQFCPQHYELGKRKKDTLTRIDNSVADLECMSPFMSYENYTIWMIAHCPADYANQTVQMKCEEDEMEGEITDFLQIIPVVSKTTEITYKNYFCAKCNNIVDVIPWGLNVTCAELWEGSLDTPQKLLELIKEKVCAIEYEPPIKHICVETDLYQQACTDESVGCPAKYKDECENGYQIPISVPFSKISYKNIYCLMCEIQDGFPRHLISCTMQKVQGFKIIDLGIARFSFGILVDYNPSVGNNVGFVFEDNLKLFGCGLEDSENTECVSYCADGFQYTNGECVLKYYTFDMAVSGMWSIRNSDLLDMRKWKPLKKTLTELFVHILESCIIEVISLEHDFYPGYVKLPGIQFNISCLYKLNVGNIVPLIEIHKTMFNNILTKTISVLPKTSTELDLFRACLTLFGQTICWDHGRISTSGEIVTNGDISTFESNKTNQTNNETMAIPPKVQNTTDCPRKPTDPNSVKILTNGSVLFTDTGNLVLKDEILLVGKMVYVCVNESEESVAGVWKYVYDDTMGYLSIICTSLSLLCLLIRLIIQPFVPLFQNFPGKLQFLFILSMFLASLFFIIGPNFTHIKDLCITFGVLIHWSYLAMFTWTMIIARDMFHIFSPASFAKSTDKNVSVLKLYALIAWGVPAIIVAICFGLDFTNINPSFKPMYGRGICWISQKYALLIFFTSPIAITILVNLGFFILTSIILWKSTHQRAKKFNKTTEYPFAIYSKLFCLMGFTWIFAFIAPYNTVLWYIFIVLNASQGVYIFIAFVLRKQIWNDFSLSGKPKDRPSSKLGMSSQKEKVQTQCSTVSGRMRNEVCVDVNGINVEMKGDTEFSGSKSQPKFDKTDVTEMT